MLKLFPDIKHQQGLYLSAFFDFFEFRSMNYNDKGELVPSPGPRSAEEAKAQRAQYQNLRKAYYPPKK